MQRYYFRTHNDKGEVSDLAADFATRDAAWLDMANVCGDLIGDATRGLRPDAEWQIELLDVCKRPLFRIRVVTESFG
jgi:hypothetical protein